MYRLCLQHPRRIFFAAFPCRRQLHPDFWQNGKISTAKSYQKASAFVLPQQSFVEIPAVCQRFFRKFHFQQKYIHYLIKYYFFVHIQRLAAFEHLRWYYGRVENRAAVHSDNWKTNIHRTAFKGGTGKIFLELNDRTLRALGRESVK